MPGNRRCILITLLLPLTWHHHGACGRVPGKQCSILRGRVPSFDMSARLTIGWHTECVHTDQQSHEPRALWKVEGRTRMLGHACIRANAWLAGLVVVEGTRGWLGTLKYSHKSKITTFLYGFICRELTFSTVLGTLGRQLRTAGRAWLVLPNNVGRDSFTAEPVEQWRDTLCT